jgi:hypothetical protein
MLLVLVAGFGVLTPARPLVLAFLVGLIACDVFNNEAQFEKAAQLLHGAEVAAVSRDAVER